PFTLSDGSQQARLLETEGSLQGRPGDLVSLVPIGGDAVGITTAGLAFPLHDGALTFGSSRGISNVLTGPQASVSLRQGLLLVFLIPAHDKGGAS
ncbi:MAG: thiamine diphosphokinase, partial [Anaerolineales bacterium]